MRLFIGVDVGTQGARVLACDANGKVVAQASESFRAIAASGLPKRWSEQNPEGWWTVVCRCLKEVACSIDGDIAAISIDSTSGTIVPIDEKGTPLHNALMYNDGRAVDQAIRCNEAAPEFTNKMGYKFGASFALPKILWLKDFKPELFSRTHRFLHAADFLMGRLTGDYTLSDYSNALKAGYDLADLCWPDFICEKLSLPLSMLPNVIAPGEIAGKVSAAASEATGIKEGTPVVAGVSDGTAGFIASGAKDLGDWNSTLGTTLVLRGISNNLINDPIGRIYCHRHPDGWWLPGGASNVGGQCLKTFFPRGDYAELDERAAEYLPTTVMVYPLVGKGERLPFISGTAEGFVVGRPRNTAELYAAYLQGVAFVEKWCFDLMSEIGADTSGNVYATGGGATSNEWLRIRANVCGKQFIRPRITESAMGSAIVAASRTEYSCLSEANAKMVTVDTCVTPDEERTKAYSEQYQRFRLLCQQRNLG